ncbi:MAG: hypothetical protein GY803_18350 [Chloroflexi bacterium]|nr:hypothetical protein [Chloroflexota bacterium]
MPTNCGGGSDLREVDAMKQKAVSLLVRFYTWLLRLYPASFRDAFGEEMTAVFAQSLLKAKENGFWTAVIVSWRELRDFPLAIFREHLSKPGEKTAMTKFIKQSGNLEEATNAGQDGPAARWETVLALFPFLWPALGLLTPLLAAIVERWLPANTDPADAPQWLIALVGMVVVSFMAFTFLGPLLLGWLRGFPRWSYAYLGLILPFSALLTRAATPGLNLFGYTFGRSELWGWRAWMPVLFVAGLAFLITRSVRFQARVFTNVWCDWTRLSFAFYGAVPLLLGISFDEVHNSYEAHSLAASAILLALGAYLYVRGTSVWRRIIALVGGFTLSWTIAIVFLSTHWHERFEVGMPRSGPDWSETTQRMTQEGVVLIVWLLAPALIGVLRRSARSLQTT